MVPRLLALGLLAAQQVEQQRLRRRLKGTQAW
jgi:hypothetical protein